MSEDSAEYGSDGLQNIPEKDVRNHEIHWTLQDFSNANEETVAHNAGMFKSSENVVAMIRRLDGWTEMNDLFEWIPLNSTIAVS